MGKSVESRTKRLSEESEIRGSSSNKIDKFRLREERDQSSKGKRRREKGIFQAKQKILGNPQEKKKGHDKAPPSGLIDFDTRKGRADEEWVNRTDTIKGEKGVATKEETLRRMSSSGGTYATNRKKDKEDIGKGFWRRAKGRALRCEDGPLVSIRANVVL